MRCSARSKASCSSTAPTTTCRRSPRLEAIDQPAAQKAIKEIIKPEAMTWVIVGDLKKIEAPVRALKLGQVQVLDVDGKPVKR